MLRSQVYRSPLQHFTCRASIRLASLHSDFDPQFQNLEEPRPGGDAEAYALKVLKDSLYGNRQFPASGSFRQQSGDVPQPALLSGFEGNPMGNGVPNDNDVAISNAGMILSVINSSIYIYDSTGANLFAVSLSAFSDTLGLPYSKYDPRVLYDPLHDKFIIVFLSGFDPESSDIIVGFSQDADPLGNWNLYALPGNPKDNDKWTDFPTVAITGDELFITGNLLIPDEPWQTGFSESLIWQMPLDAGYAGTDLGAVYYDSIYFGGNPIRNLCPVAGGSGSHGPDMFFLSDRNFSPDNDTIFILHLTGTLDDPGTTLLMGFALTDPDYGVPPQARQYAGNIFDTNDGRVLDAFYEDGQIQFVANSLDPSTGFAAVYHGIISDPGGTPTIHAHIIGDSVMDFGYPSIAYTGKWEGDDQSIIIFDHSAPDVYAGVSAVYFNYDTYSPVEDVKTGDTWVNVLTGTYERWGDYTGAQRRYNAPGKVWISGNFGKEVDDGPIIHRNNATWIASLQSTDTPAQGIAQQPDTADVQIYPNPAGSYFTTEINLQSPGRLQFRLYDMRGHLVKLLLDTQASEGRNVFSFSTRPLSAGNYYLQIEKDGNLIDSEEVVKI